MAANCGVSPVGGVLSVSDSPVSLLLTSAATYDNNMYCGMVVRSLGSQNLTIDFTSLYTEGCCDHVYVVFDSHSWLRICSLLLLGALLAARFDYLEMCVRCGHFLLLECTARSTTAWMPRHQ